MFCDSTLPKIIELERADILSQVRLWARVFENPSLEH
jgi:hypothetical protein